MLMFVYSVLSVLLNSILSVILSFRAIRIRMDLLTYLAQYLRHLVAQNTFICPMMRSLDVFGQIRAMVFLFEKSLRTV